MAPRMRMCRYKPEQKEWLVEKIKSKRYQSKGGNQIRVGKLLNAYRNKFGEHRPIEAFGMKLRQMKLLAGLGKARTRSYKKRAVIEAKHMTLHDMEAKLRPIVNMIDTIKDFMG